MATITAENFSFSIMIGLSELGPRQMGKRILRSDRKAELKARFNCKKPMMGVQTRRPGAAMGAKHKDHVGREYIESCVL